MCSLTLYRCACAGHRSVTELVPIPFYLHKMRMRLEEDEFEMEVGFSARLGVDFNLLGMDLFDRYKVTFNNAAKKVTYNP